MGSTGSNDIGEPAHRHRFEHGRFHRSQQMVGWRARAKERGSRRRILRLGYFFRRRVRHFLCGEKESARISERWARFNFRRDVDFDETHAFGFRFHRNAHQMSQRQRKADPLCPNPAARHFHHWAVGRLEATDGADSHRNEYPRQL